MLTDDQDRRLLLVELRQTPGAVPGVVHDRFRELFRDVFGGGNVPPPVGVGLNYMRCVLDPDEVRRLVAGGADSYSGESADRAAEIIRHVWPDLVVEGHLDRSRTTIKADAASRTYGCSGTGVVWAVLDSGIDEHHPHFAANATLSADSVKDLHQDFTIATPPQVKTGPLTDPVGHGTHVAAIIAGCAPTEADALRIACNEPTVDGLPQWTSRTLPDGSSLSGVAPKANVVSLKVLDENNKTVTSVIIDALTYVRMINGFGKNLQIHGVNLSLGCGWLPQDRAAGQSPLCEEIDLLVGTGVVAVISAGNAGAGGTITGLSSSVYGQLSTITDPGNADTAITVGSVHRYRPHTYGVTFDSSKGPTLDGRAKPDLVAPGERITSAATGRMSEGVPPFQPAPNDPPNVGNYIEDSGTSMAAAHVSGVIAALLSAREEYIGQPQLVKKLLTDTATDLGRHAFFQGAGLVDLMRALSAT
jgi:subtilisin family serine protease